MDLSDRGPDLAGSYLSLERALEYIQDWLDATEDLAHLFQRRVVVEDRPGQQWTVSYPNATNVSYRIFRDELRE